VLYIQQTTANTCFAIASSYATFASAKPPANVMYRQLVGVHCIYIGFLNHTLIMKKIILLNFCNYSGIKLSIPLILSLSKDKADVKTGSWFDKLTMSVLKTLAQNT
jgi:hypothetical protein